MQLSAFRVRGLRSVLSIACVLAALTASASPLVAQQAFPPDSAIRAILRERVESGRSAGIIVGVLDPDGRRHVVAFPTSGSDNAIPLDSHAVFEIGSVTKVFTAAVLAYMVDRGEVRLEDAVGRYLPTSVRVPANDGRPITLLDLATHTSGLPRTPGNLAPADSGNPYADYTVDRMYEFLSGYTLPRAPGVTFEYSNVGMGLLGHALARRAGVSYEELAIRRILEPLGMRDTRITLTPAMRARLVTGHNAAGRPVANWDFPALAGAGALRSTMNDMLAFAAANLDSTGPLGRVLAGTHEPQRATQNPNLRIGLGWHVLTAPAVTLHNGQTGGYHSFLGLDKARRVAVVVLSSSGTDIDDIGMHLLDPRVPLQVPPRARTEVTLDPAILDTYVGEYELVPGFTITVTRVGNALFGQASGQPKFQMAAESPTEFFLRVVDAQISFVKDSTGTVMGLVLHQSGQDAPGRRIR